MKLLITIAIFELVWSARSIIYRVSIKIAGLEKSLYKILIMLIWSV